MISISPEDKVKFFSGDSGVDAKEFRGFTKYKVDIKCQMGSLPSNTEIIPAYVIRIWKITTPDHAHTWK